MHLLCLLLVCVIGPVTAGIFWSTEQEWQAFKDAFGKTYKDDMEDTFRRNVFENNLRQIRKHNLEADLGQHRFRLGINQNADLNHREYRNHLGFRPTNGTHLGATFLEPSFVRLPNSVDWRKKGYVTPVKNQGQCGSCWAFSSTGALEGQHFRKTGRLVSLSEQNLLDCTRNSKYNNAGCNGGWMWSAFLYVRDNRGIDTEVSYPYEGKNRTCRFKRRTVGATDAGFVTVRRGDEQALKVAVATVGPISVAIDASHSNFHFYKSGIYEDPNCSTTEVDHAVLVVGYGTEKGRDYWLVKNSWGGSWGLDGYIKMARNRGNMCGIASYAFYPLV